MEESQSHNNAAKGIPGIWLLGDDSGLFVRTVEVTTIFLCSLKFLSLCATPSEFPLCLPSLVTVFSFS